MVIGLPWAKKIIWAPTLEESQERAYIILERCDLVPGQKVLTQDYLTGLWSDSATNDHWKREEDRSNWVKDDQGHSFITGRRHLKEISFTENSKQETSSNLFSISRLTVNIDYSKGSKVKLHKIPSQSHILLCFNQSS